MQNKNLLTGGLISEGFSPKKRNSIGQKCPREFTYFVHKNSPFMSTRIPPFLSEESNLAPLLVDLSQSEKKIFRYIRNQGVMTRSLIKKIAGVGNFGM